jgi:hypothetical protein
MKLLEKDVHEKQDTIISLRFVIVFTTVCGVAGLDPVVSESRVRFVGENLHALKRKSLGQTTITVT